MSYLFTKTKGIFEMSLILLCLTFSTIFRGSVKNELDFKGVVSSIFPPESIKKNELCLLTKTQK